MTTDLLQKKKEKEIWGGKKLLMCRFGRNCEKKTSQVVFGPSHTLQRKTVSDIAAHGCSAKQNKTT